MVQDGTKLIGKNRQAFRSYSVEERYEAGLVLVGSEIKSIRAGKVSFQDAHAVQKDGELWLVGLHIAEYSHASYFGHEPTRDRKLLLNRFEIKKIIRRIDERGYAAIPLSIYLKNGKAKLELGLARGKRQTDRRQEIRRRDENRQAERDLRERNR
jgi:SsrA-binding protein